MPNPIDKLIGWVSPARGLSRHFARQRLARAYEAASPRDPWRPRRLGASANADHMADASILRGKARALVQNVPYVRAGLEALTAYTVGTGIIPRATGRDADALNKAFMAWAKVCDADGRLDFWGIQAAAYRAMEQDGEVLLRLRPRRPADGLPAPLQLQLLEIDWLDSGRTGTENGNQVVNGIEYDFLGRAVAYWLWDQHPGDIALRRGMRSRSQRVPAGSIVHLFAPERPGQGRGFTRLGPIIPRVRDLQLYEDAELARKNLETRLSVLASGDLSQMANPAAESGSADPINARTTGELGELASGGITSVPDGLSLTVVEPKAAGGHVEYVKHQLHVIATGMGVTYEMLTGDMKEVNFSSARVRMLDFRRQVQAMQWLTIVPRLLDPVWRAFCDAASLQGVIGKPDYAVEYSMPKWDYVNPVQDVQSDLLEIGGGLSSLSEKLRQRGYEPDKVFAESADDFEALRKLGLFDTLMFLQKGATPDSAAAEAAAKQSARSLADAQAALQRLEAQVATLLARAVNVNVQAGDTHVAPAQVEVRNDVHVPGQAAPTINVAAPSVEIRNDVHVPEQQAPTVNVAAPNVEIRNDIQPAVVQLSMPARHTETTITERDAQGRAVRSVQTERNA